MAQCKLLFFCLFQCFAEKEYQTESKRNETFARIIFGTNAIQETLSGRQGSNEASTRQGGAPRGQTHPHPRGRPGTLLAQFFYSGGFFWSIKNHQKLARQLDSVWYSFSVKLKNKEKQKLALGSRLIGQSQKSYKIAYKCI